MAEIPVSDEEMALRRRARRRLVGAVALALTAIVLLPMLFDPEPKPLGPDIDVQIPSQDTPFKPATPAPPAAPEPAPSMLNPVETTPPSQAAPLPVAKPAEPTAASKPVEPAKAAGKEADKPAVKKPEATSKPEVTSKPESANKPAGKGYSLQLGLFDKKANADKLIERVRAIGFKAQASEVQGRWRVLIGPLAERAKAEEARAKLKAKGLDAVLVAP